MSMTITTAFVQMFKANVLQLAQQHGSKLRESVRIEMVQGNALYFERLGSQEAQARLSRHSDTPVLNTPHTRRRVTLVDYEWADLVDIVDKVRILINPESEYAQAAAWAMGRKQDDLIIAAADGSAFGGVDGSTTVAFDTTMDSGDTTTAMSLSKITKSKYLLDLNDVSAEDRIFVVSPKQIQDLLTNVQEIKSSDYNTVKALSDGQIDTYLGFKFKWSTRLATASSVRSCLYYQKSALGLAIGKDVTSRIAERVDKSFSTQVYFAMSMGATRIEEARVGRCKCSEA